jgi:hypothetical protein
MPSTENAIATGTTTTEAAKETVRYYLIGYAGARGTPRSRAYHGARRRLEELLPGVKLHGWQRARHHLPEGCTAAADRAGWLAASYCGAVVISCGSASSGWWTGRGSVAEAEAFTEAGKDVHVFLDGHLVPWAQIRVEVTEEPVSPSHPRAGTKIRLEVIEP